MKTTAIKLTPSLQDNPRLQGQRIYSNPNNITRPSSCRTELILIRGLPGSGKSTWAKTLADKGYAHFEADMFFERDGVYQYDPARIQDAHRWCQMQAIACLSAGRRVVVANTFTRLREMQPYMHLTTNVRVLEAKGQWQNVHGVSAERVQQMAERWEPLP